MEIPMKRTKQDLKEKSASELIEFAKENDVENASSLRKQELYFAILQNLADQDIEILGQGVIEVLQDGFGFLRSADANYLPGFRSCDCRRCSRPSCRSCASRTGQRHPRGMS